MRDGLDWTEGRRDGMAADVERTGGTGSPRSFSSDDAPTAEDSSARASGHPQGGLEPGRGLTALERAERWPIG